MSAFLYHPEELDTLLKTTEWHRIAQRAGFKDSGEPQSKSGIRSLIEFLTLAGINDLDELRKLLDGLSHARGAYFLTKVRSLTADTNFNALPEYVIQHLVCLLMPDRTDLMRPKHLGEALRDALQEAIRATLKRDKLKDIDEPGRYLFETLRLKGLMVRNYRGFETYAIPELAPGLSLLIGENGSGKTALVDAISKCLATRLYSLPKLQYLMPDLTSYMLFEENIYRKSYLMGQSIIRGSRVELEVAIQAIANDEETPISLTTNALAANQTYVEPNPFLLWAEQVSEGYPVTLPVLAYFGAGRLWQQIPSPEPLGNESRMEGYRDCLNPASDQTSLFRWFKKNEWAASQKKERRHVLEAVRQAIVSMIPDAMYAEWDADYDELIIHLSQENETIIQPFKHLSDGYRNIVAIAGDIAWRMAQLNPQLEADVLNETPGVVLIDEIDLHLHPNWQRIVVDRLLATFPNIQFIATTHSPFIIQSLYGKGDEVMLWDVGKQQALPLDVKSIEDIAEEKQGVELPQQSQRFLDMMNVAEEYYALLEQKPESEVEIAALKQKLDLLLTPYSDDPAFQASLRFKRRVSGLDDLP